jgi:Flp pilus assembly protein TadD
MASAASPGVSTSFVKLVRLGASFTEIEARGRLPVAHERTVRRLVVELGATAVPALVRQLCGGRVTSAGWAAALLEELAERPDGPRLRVAAALRAAAAEATVNEPARMRVLSLLARIGVELPATVTIPNLFTLRDRSLRELASSLDSAAEVARAADLLVTQLDDDDLLDFCDDFVTREPASAAALLDEMLGRDDVGEQTRGELRRLRAPLAVGPRSHAGRGPGGRPMVQGGRHRDGRHVLVAVTPRPGVPRRYRALVAVIGKAGLLEAVTYQPELTLGALQRNVVAPLRTAGFALRRATLRLAASRIAVAARAARADARKLPSDFYLGRDIVGLTSEHLGAGPPSSHHAALLSRALDLLAAGEQAQARPLLLRYVALRPEDPEGCANLGVCLLGLGAAGEALTHLRRAIWLEPQGSLHFWNLAAAHHARGDLGGCYLALTDYVDRNDTSARAEERQRVAAGFLAEYDRLARVAHTNVDPTLVARADQRYALAAQALADGRFEDAIACFRELVRDVPSYAAAWRDLGAAYLDVDLPAQARRCLAAALALAPADPATRRQLELLGGLRSSPGGRAGRWLHFAPPRGCRGQSRLSAPRKPVSAPGE